MKIKEIKHQGKVVRPLAVEVVGSRFSYFDVNDDHENMSSAFRNIPDGTEVEVIVRIKEAE